MTARRTHRAEAHRAEALGGSLPPLLVAAERVAATVAAGAHGRRRTGTGDVFWQYRPFLPGDPASRIDWRKTGKSDRATIRETEWEAAQTLCLWRDESASMRWRSRTMPIDKIERAELLLLALAALLLRGGERVRLIGQPGRVFAGRAALGRLAEALAIPASQDPAPHNIGGLPPDDPLPRHARAVLIGDFLAPLPEIGAALQRIAGNGVSGQIVQVLDPAEATLPYSGRVRFRGVEDEAELLIARTEQVRDAYAAALAAQQQGLAALARAAGFGLIVHHTDHAPETALLALYTALAPR